MYEVMRLGVVFENISRWEKFLKMTKDIQQINYCCSENVFISKLTTRLHENKIKTFEPCAIFVHHIPSKLTKFISSELRLRVKRTPIPLTHIIHTHLFTHAIIYI